MRCNVAYKVMRVFFPLLLAMSLTFVTISPVAAAPGHNAKHCSAAFAQLVASGGGDTATTDYYFTGSQIMAKIGKAAPIVYCVLSIVGEKVAKELTTFTVVDTPTRTAADYVKKQVLARKAIHVSSEKIKSMGLKVIPRAPTLLVITLALCNQTRNDHAWMPMDMKIQCGFVKVN